MNKEELHDYCMSLPQATEHFPFDDVTLVFKVGGKMFAGIPLDNPDTLVFLKCDPGYALELREEHEDILPAWHFNKKHWNMVYTERSLPPGMQKKLIRHSYDLVADKLPKKVKEELFGKK